MFAAVAVATAVTVSGATQPTELTVAAAVAGLSLSGLEPLYIDEPPCKLAALYYDTTLPGTKVPVEVRIVLANKYFSKARKWDPKVVAAIRVREVVIKPAGGGRGP